MSSESDSGPADPIEPPRTPAPPNDSPARDEPRTVRLTHAIGFATALIGLVTAALVLWQVYRAPAQPPLDGAFPSVDPSPAAESTPAPTESATPTVGPSTDDGTESPTDGTSESVSTEGDLPDVTGMHSLEARSYLEELGFTNIVLYDDDHNWIGAMPAHCTVREQDPQGGRTVPLDLQINLGYFNDPWPDPGDVCT